MSDESISRRIWRIANAADLRGEELRSEELRAFFPSIKEKSFSALLSKMVADKLLWRRRPKRRGGARKHFVYPPRMEPLPAKRGRPLEADGPREGFMARRRRLAAAARRRARKP